MPALPNVPNVVRVRLKGQNSGQVYNNVIYLQYTPPAPTTADLTTLANTIATAWTTNLASLQHGGVSLLGQDLADLTAPTAASISTTHSIPGTRPGTPLLTSAALVVSWQINVRYRGGHPRTYFPWGVVADTTGARLWAAAFVTSALAGARAFRTALNAMTTGTTTYKLVCVSYRRNNLLLPSPVVYSINDAAVHGRVDTQRHRLGKETP